MKLNGFVGYHGKAIVRIALVYLLAVMISIYAFAEADSQNSVYSDCTWAEYNAMTEEQQVEFYNSFSDPEDFDDWMYYAYTASVSKLPYPDKAPAEYTLAEYEALNDVQRELFYESFENADEFDAWWRTVSKKPLMFFYTYDEFASKDEARREEYIASFTDEDGFGLWLDSAIANTAVHEGKQLYEYSLREVDKMDAENQKTFFEAFENEAAVASWLAFEQWKLQTDMEYACTWAEFMAMDGVEKEAFHNTFESEAEFEYWAISAQLLSEKKHYEYTLAEYEALDVEQKNAFIGLFENEEAFENWMIVARVLNNKSCYELNWEEFEALNDEQQKAFIGLLGSDDAFEQWMQDAR